MHVKRNALHDVLPRDVLLQSLQPSEAKLVGPTFAAARGAVEPAKRVMEAREGSVETAVCKWWRRWVSWEVSSVFSLEFLYTRMKCIPTII